MSVAVGIVALISAMAYNIMAEEPAINPARVTTPQIVVYGTTSASTFAGDVSVAGASIMGGAITSPSITGTDVTVSDDFIITAQSQNVTNGQVVTLESGSLLFGTGQAAQLTNVVTFAAPGSAYVGKLAIVAIGATSSNIVSLADSGTVDLSAAFLMGVGDTLTLYGSSATLWLEVARSNN